MRDKKKIVDDIVLNLNKLVEDDKDTAIEFFKRFDNIKTINLLMGLSLFAIIVIQFVTLYYIGKL